MYFNVNFNVFFLKKGHLLVSELYIYQNARCNNKKLETLGFQCFPKPDNFLRLTLILILNYLYIISVLVIVLATKLYYKNIM